MTVQLSDEARVTQKLFDQFYIYGKVDFDQNASSHWLDFSRNITARFSGKSLYQYDGPHLHRLTKLRT